MTNKKVWFITGAGRGMGVDFAKAALADGHAVVATGRHASATDRRTPRPVDLARIRRGRRPGDMNHAKARFDSTEET